MKTEGTLEDAVKSIVKFNEGGIEILQKLLLNPAFEGSAFKPTSEITPIFNIYESTLVVPFCLVVEDVKFFIDGTVENLSGKHFNEEQQNFIEDAAEKIKEYYARAVEGEPTESEKEELETPILAEINLLIQSDSETLDDYTDVIRGFLNTPPRFNYEGKNLASVSFGKNYCITIWLDDGTLEYDYLANTVETNVLLSPKDMRCLADFSERLVRVHSKKTNP